MNTTLTTYAGIPISQAFPSWVTACDRPELEFWCEAELNQWRAVLAQHKAAPTVNRKLALRPALEQAWRDLRGAYRAATAWANEQDQPASATSAA